MQAQAGPKGIIISKMVNSQTVELLVRKDVAQADGEGIKEPQLLPITRKSTEDERLMSSQVSSRLSGQERLAI